MATEKKLTGKNSSLIAQIIGALWIGGWSAGKFLASIETTTIGDIMMSGVAIAACFTPVYFSIIMDKIKDIKIGGQK